MHLLLIIIFTSITAGVLLTLPFVVDFSTRVIGWCEGIIDICVPYLPVVKSFVAWPGVVLILAGVLFAILRVAIQGLRVRGVIKGLTGVDAGEGLTLINNRTLKLAFTHGLVRPRVYISSGLVHGLTRDETKAVVLHENHHRRSRDPLLFFLLSIVKDLLFFLPITHWLTERIRHARETRADDAVVAVTGDRLTLASALVKVVGYNAGAAGLNRSAGGASIEGSTEGSMESFGSFEHRVLRLVEKTIPSKLQRTGPPSRPPIRHLISSTVISVLVFLSLSIPVIASVGAPDECTMAHCTMHKTMTNEDCMNHC